MHLFYRGFVHVSAHLALRRHSIIASIFICQVKNLLGARVSRLPENADVSSGLLHSGVPPVLLPADVSSGLLSADVSSASYPGTRTSRPAFFPQTSRLPLTRERGRLVRPSAFGRSARAPAILLRLLITLHFLELVLKGHHITARVD
jgi:hypothetical protein